MCDRPRTLLSSLALALVCSIPLAAQPGASIVHIPGRDLLGTAINSPDIELAPLLSPDGATLYFDRKYSFENVGGTDDDDDIYYSTLGKDGVWSPAKNIGPPLNTPGSDVLFWISPDGNTALVHNGGKIKGKSVGLAITQRVKGVWGKPAPISIKGMESLGDVSDAFGAFISPDGHRLILAYSGDSTQPDNLDLFSCPAIGSDYMQWGAPESLGSTINTPVGEWGPWMAADNRTLYFISDGYPGKGASDVYMSRRVGSGWGGWTEPVNLGDTINMPGYDVGFCPSADGTYAYLSAQAITHDDTYGQTDIFRVRIPGPFQPLPFGTIVGRLSSKTAPVQGLVRVEEATSGSEIGSSRSDPSGGFSFTLPAGIRYRVTGWADGYDEASTEVELANAGDRSIISIPLTPEGKPKRKPGSRP